MKALYGLNIFKYLTSFYQSSLATLAICKDYYDIS